MDADSFAALYRQHAPGIRTYCYRRTSDAELAEDLCQETFANALAAMRRGVEIRHVSGWLYRIAHNLVIDHYRARDRRDALSLGDPVQLVAGRMEYTDYAGYAVEIDDRLLRDPRDMEAEMVNRLDLAESFGRAECCLTDKQATTLNLRFWEGYAFAEIADAMDKTEGAVKALQHRAIVNLRERMAA